MVAWRQQTLEPAAPLQIGNWYIVDLQTKEQLGSKICGPIHHQKTAAAVITMYDDRTWRIRLLRPVRSLTGFARLTGRTCDENCAGQTRNQKNPADAIIY
jgi:hypothetical protein